MRITSFLEVIRSQHQKYSPEKIIELADEGGNAKTDVRESKALTTCRFTPDEVNNVKFHCEVNRSQSKNSHIKED